MKIAHDTDASMLMRMAGSELEFRLTTSSAEQCPGLLIDTDFH